jgi:hypothetical protein
VLACAAGGTGLTGALYTGRGPVWGTIIRGGGATAEATGTCTCGATGREPATGTAGALATEVTLAAVAGGAAERCGAGGIWAGAAGLGGRTVLATGGTDRTGETVGGVAGTAGGLVGATTPGLAAAGGAATAAGGPGTAAVGLRGGATASFCCVIALRTSPGREMLERSILVLISSSPRDARADFEVAGCASAAARK